MSRNQASPPAGGRRRTLPPMEAFPLDYDVPPHLIAQEPVEPRDHARLLVVRRRPQALAHHQFLDLAQLLGPGDLLILNDTRVLPARLIGTRAATGGKWEGLFLRQFPDGTWEMLSQTRGRLQPGERVHVQPGPVVLELVARLPEGRWQVRPEGGGDPIDLLGRVGRVPLPPYIRKGTANASDRERYQTVYAREPGAVAAPTAGLHFTPRVFEQLRQRGIGWEFVTLHVGLGTFRPIEAADYTRHPMHREWGRMPEATAQAIHDCRRRRGRVVAVGTTAVRVLETAARLGPLAAWSGETDLFIHPPYKFRAVDALVTNLHLPRTTLLLLVGAFAGVDLLGEAYRAAIAEKYRFYSYGDAMLVLP
jgi:S-adenosylmethionine:tRNA ribosyltransferase-isomerase